MDEIEIKLLAIHGPRVKKIILYGSFTRGEGASGSDLDVMVLLDMKEEAIEKHSEEVLALAVALTTRYGIVVSIQKNNIDFFNEWADTLPFFHNVINEGVELYGKRETLSKDRLSRTKEDLHTTEIMLANQHKLILLSDNPH